MPRESRRCPPLAGDRRATSASALSNIDVICQKAYTERMEHTRPKLTSLHVSLPEDLKEFVRLEVAAGGYSTPSDFVRTLLRERRAQKLRERIDETLLASLDTPAEEVTPEYLASLRQDAKALMNRKEASGRKPRKEV